MLSRWFFTKLKAAENALRAGRIDEAFQRLTTPENRANREAAPLIDDLAQALTARARLALQAGRYRECLDDLDKVHSLDRDTPEAAGLRQRAAAELHARAAAYTDQAQAYQQVAQQFRDGRLESARLALEHVDDPAVRAQLREELDVRGRRSDDLAIQARQAVAAGDPLTACQFVRQAMQRYGTTAALDAVMRELVPHLRQTLESLLTEGRLDRLGDALKGVALLRPTDPTLAEFDRFVRLAGEAAGRLAAGDYVALREGLLRLGAMRPQASWIREAQAHLAALAEAEARLIASPLGLLDASVEHSGRFVGTARAAAAAGRDAANGAERGAALAHGGLLLLVDGTGSCLLTARDIVRIGRAGGGAEVDVPLPASIQSHHADIIREGDDYFLLARGPLRVNQRPVQRVLLRDGDRITLAEGVRFGFHKPSAKSDSAVLRISDRCRPPQDVSSVVLFRSTCLVGPTPSCHVATREGRTRLVIYEREGELLARLDERGQRGVPLAPGQTRDLGDVRLTVKPYDVKDAGGRA